MYLNKMEFHYEEIHNPAAGGGVYLLVSKTSLLQVYIVKI